MEWSGRAPAPPASEAGKGQSQGARHVTQTRSGILWTSDYKAPDLESAVPPFEQSHHAVLRIVDAAIEA
jgi:hypothetical protein